MKIIIYYKNCNEYFFSNFENEVYCFVCDITILNENFKKVFEHYRSFNEFLYFIVFIFLYLTKSLFINIMFNMLQNMFIYFNKKNDIKR